MIFSVIVPHFKESESVFAKCRESIRVAIDKLGKPDLVEILEEYGVDGVSSARNRGIARAKGEWLLFVDADDVVTSDWLESIDLAICNNPDADIIAFGECDDEALFSGIWNKAYKRSVLPKGGFGPYAHGEDRLFLVKALLNAKKIVKLRKQLYEYRPSACSVTKQPRNLKWIIDTLGYSGEMIKAMEGYEVPLQLYHDIAVWTLEECSWVMRSLPSEEKKIAIEAWCAFLPKIIQCRNMSMWYRFVAHACLLLKSFAITTLCHCPRVLKRIIYREMHGSS